VNASPSGPNPPERKPLVGGRGILAGMGVALAFAGLQFLLVVADQATPWSEWTLGLGYSALAAWFAVKRRQAVAGGMAIGMVLLPVLAFLVLLSICASGGFR
jgi:hypothetical protein